MSHGDAREPPAAARPAPRGACGTFLKFLPPRGPRRSFAVASALPAGAWDAAAAPTMVWSDDDVWVLEVDAAKGSEYKVVVCDERGPVEWEPGENRVLPKEDGTVVLKYGVTGGVLKPATEEEKDSEAAGAATSARGGRKAPERRAAPLPTVARLAAAFRKPILEKVSGDCTGSARGPTRAPAPPTGEANYVFASLLQAPPKPAEPEWIPAYIAKEDDQLNVQRKQQESRKEEPAVARAEARREAPPAPQPVAIEQPVVDLEKKASPPPPPARDPSPAPSSTPSASPRTSSEVSGGLSRMLRPPLLAFGAAVPDSSESGHVDCIATWAPKFTKRRACSLAAARCVLGQLHRGREPRQVGRAGVDVRAKWHEERGGARDGGR